MPSFFTIKKKICSFAYFVNSAASADVSLHDTSIFCVLKHKTIHAATILVPSRTEKTE
jgi:hypothetical protein